MALRRRRDDTWTGGGHARARAPVVPDLHPDDRGRARRPCAARGPAKVRRRRRGSRGGPHARAGVLKRILLVYDHVRERIAAKTSFPVEAVTEAATLIRSFIEEYHEKLEEDRLFPRCRKKGKLVELVDILEAQHKAGRQITDRVLALAKDGLKADPARQELATVLHQFVRMYAPH